MTDEPSKTFTISGPAESRETQREIQFALHGKDFALATWNFKNEMSRHFKHLDLNQLSSEDTIEIVKELFNEEFSDLLAILENI